MADISTGASSGAPGRSRPEAAARAAPATNPAHDQSLLVPMVARSGT